MIGRTSIRVIAAAGVAAALTLATVGSAAAADTVPAGPPDCNEELVNAGAAVGGSALGGGAVGGPPGALGGAIAGGIAGGTGVAQCLQK